MEKGSFSGHTVTGAGDSEGYACLLFPALHLQMLNALGEAGEHTAARSREKTLNQSSYRLGTVTTVRAWMWLMFQPVKQGCRTGRGQGKAGAPFPVGLGNSHEGKEKRGASAVSEQSTANAGLCLVRASLASCSGNCCML